MAERASGPGGLVSVAGVAAVLLATLSFVPIVQGLDWWAAAVVFAVLAVLATAGARALGMPAVAAGIVGVAAIPLLATALAGQGLGFAVLLPTGASSQAVMTAVSAAQTQIIEDSVPAGSTPGLVLLMACGIALAAVVVDTVAVGLRAPLGAVPIVVALAIVPGKALRTGTSGWLLAVVLLALLLLIAADRRRRRSAARLPGLVAGAAGAAVLALLAQGVLPVPAQAEAALPLQPLFGPGADPLIRLGDDLRRGPRAGVLTYTTTSRNPVYLRLAVLERFTGTVWRPNATNGVPLVTGSAPAVPGIGAGDGSAVTTAIQADAPEALGTRLPLPYPATSVAGVTGYTWDTRGLTLERDDRGVSPTAYDVKSLDVSRSAADLRAARTSEPPGDPDALTLPSAVPERIRSTVDRWTRGASSPYAKALAIQNELRGPSFTYDQDAPSRQGYEGDGLKVIDTFLKSRSGYCVHFASTMAVMARLVDIPSRVVVGYQPGERTAGSGIRARYAVSSDDLHAWPELYFDGAGWVRFEPTPGRGAVPSYAPQPQATGSAAATPSARPTRALPTSASTTPAIKPDSSTPTSGSGPQAASVLRPVGTLAAIVALLALPGLLRVLIRRRRLRGTGSGAGVAALWREVLDSAADLGAPPPRDASPRAVAADLAARFAAGADQAASTRALDRLRTAVEVQSYGGRTASADPADVTAVLGRMRAASSRWTRLKAAVAPVSLLGTLDPSRLAFRWSPSGSDTAGTAAAGSAARLGR